MSRELKRVPMDFSWPLEVVWGGYINPFHGQSTKCPGCDGSGYAPEAKVLSDQWYGNAPFDPVAYGATPLRPDSPAIWDLARRNSKFTGWGLEAEARRLFDLWRGQWGHHLIQADVDALVAEDRLMKFTHTPRTEEQREIVRRKIEAGGNSWLPEPNGYAPTPAEVNEWSLRGFGHDGLNKFICVEARCKREGVPVKCDVCRGSGELWPSAEIERQYEAWESIEPPVGDGFQLWEDCTEGSPVSPVFATLDELCSYAEKNCTTFGSARATATEWRRMLEDEFVYHKSGNNIFM